MKGFFPSKSLAKLMDSTATVTLLHIYQYGYLPQTDYDTIYLQRVVPTPLVYTLVGIGFS